MEMDTKRTRVTYGLVAAALCLLALAASAMPKLGKPRPNQQPQVVQKPVKKPRVEVVFALDTTGSMSGLIEGAKRKIWSIATFIAQGDPKPDLRVGLVAYRDKGDEYVTRFYDLTDDLDDVFQKLQSFEAAGGGDTPEHVAAALDEAVNRASWSSDQGVLKMVYLVGDAPPHTDYGDVDYRAVAKAAHVKNIHINTVRCGGDVATQNTWTEIAGLAAGEYTSIDQSGGMIAVATPYDDKLAELNRKLVGTAIGYGRWRGEVRAKAATAAAAPASTAADRAAFFGLKGGAVGGAGDLGRDFAEGKVKLEALPADDLPAELSGLDGDGRRRYVEEKNAERARVQAEINTLAFKRNEFLKDKKKADAFDTKLESTLKRQGKEIGVKW
jgi:Mg-chelatase subunit ChlD